jgi:hypothetical protein
VSLSSPLLLLFLLFVSNVFVYPEKKSITSVGIHHFNKFGEQERKSAPTATMKRLYSLFNQAAGSHAPQMLEIRKRLTRFDDPNGKKLLARIKYNTKHVQSYYAVVSLALFLCFVL